MAWSNVIYGGTASPNLAPFPISTPCRLVRWSSAVWYSVGGGTGGITLWTWNFFKNGAVVSQVPYFALPVGGTLVLAAGRPNVEFDLVPGTDHWGSEFVNPGGGGGIGVAVVRLCCTFEVL